MRRPLLLERLEDRVLLNAASPVAGIDLPAEDFINESFDFAVNFDNTAAAGPDSTGFAPYVDLRLPSALDLESLSIAYLGADVAPLARATFDGAQWLLDGEPLTEHPLTGVTFDGADVLTAGAVAGDQLLIVQLPFGSFTADQPVARLEFGGVDLGGTVGVANTIATRGGFAFGCDEFDNPNTDAPIVQAPVSANITPTVIELTKRHDGAEDETATGPNYPRTWILEVDIAEGETVTGLALEDVLPGASAWLGNLTFVQGGTPTVLSEPTVDTDGPALELAYGDVTGVAGPDIVVTYQLYIPDVIADDDGDDNDDGAPDNPFVNAAEVSAGYLGNPITDTASDTLTGKLVAVQKAVTLSDDVEGNGPSPGDTLSYTLDFQVSDYTDLSAITLTDVLGNGLAVDTGFAPTFVFNENGVTTGGTFGLTSVLGNPFTGNVVQSDLGGGLTRLVFDVSQELVDRGQDGTLAGDALSAATTGSVTFRARIVEEFAAPAPGPDVSIDIGDVLDNDVSVSGTTAGGDVETDSSAASIAIAGIELTKSIYAVDGDTGFDPGAGLSPGQAVTYRIRVEVPTADTENLRLTDFLPLPVFDATDVTGFTATFPPPGGVPAAGTAQYGPDHTLNAQTFLTGAPNDPPGIVTSAQNNTVEFNFGTFDAAPPAGPVVVDVLFTVTLLDKPFGDGLFLTNQAVSQFGDTAGGIVSNTEIVQIVLNQPELTLTKGAVASDNPAAVFDAAVGPVTFNGPGAANPFSGVLSAAALAATPVDANISGGVDAGDIVAFALVIENSGGAGAFDVLVRDTLPAGFQVPGGGLNLQIRTGDAAGTPVGFSTLGAGLFSAVAGEGIRIDDDGDGILAARDGAPGSNVLVVTYELEAVADIEPTTLHENAALIEAFAAREGGTDFTDGFERDEYADSASVVTAAPTVVKTLLESDRAHTDDTELAIGEIATFELLVTLPEGEIADLIVTDRLPPGMAYVPGSAQLLTTTAAAAGLAADFGGSVNLVAATSLGGSGDDIAFSLDDGAGGAVRVVADNDAASNSFVLRFDATVLDVPGNTGLAPATNLVNDARIDYTDADGAANDGIAGAATPATSNAVTATVVEPLLDVAKNIDLDAVDAGDVITVTLTLSNDGTADAFDAAVEDVLDPAKFTNVTAGAAPAGFVDASAGNLIRYNALPGFAFAEGAVAVFTFTAEITDAIVPGEVLTNTATVTGGNTLPGGGGASRDVSGDTGIDTTEVTLGLGKSIVATSETHTSGIERVAVGEIVRYRLVIELPEAAATDLTLQDLLPAGLQFVDPHAALDDSARIAFVSDGGLSSSGAVGIAAPAAFVTGDETAIDGIMPTFALADINISSVVDADVDTYASGSDVFFRLGDVVNADSDANAEFIVIEYNALVTNEAGNVAGAALANSFRALSDDNGPNTQIGADASPATVTVAEPEISVVKSLASGSGDAGDTVIYTIVVSNAAGADVTSGFEVRVQDDLDALDAGVLTLVSAVFDAGTSGASVIADASAGNLIDLTLDRLDPGTSATITVTATLATDLAAGRSVDNAASVTYSGLPGPAGTAMNPTGSALAGAPGTANGERDGSGGVNDYAGTSTSVFTVTPPAVDKRLVDESATSVGISDTVVYDLVVTLPEGRSENLRISDDVPDGLAVLGAELITNAAGSAYLANDFAGSIENAGAAGAVTAQDSGVDLLLDFGDVDVAATTATTGNQFVVRVTTVVLNLPGTSGAAGAQTTLTNGATLTYTDPDDGPGDTPLDVVVDDPSDPTVTVVEPQLTIAKDVVVGGGGNTGDAGDSAVWTMVVAHDVASTATAYELDLSDTLPAAFTPASFTATIAIAGDANAAFALAGNTLSTVAAFDLALGETLTVTVTGVLADALAAGSTLANTATLEFSSADGDVTDTLGGAAGPNDAADDERRYAIDDMAAVTVPAPTFEKILVGSDESATADGLGEVTIGETVTYAIVLTLPEGSYTEFVISDDLPAGLDFVDGSARLVAPPAYAGTLPTVTTVGGVGAGDDVTFTLSAPFIVAGDNLAGNNSLRIEYEAVVVDAGNSGAAGAQSNLGNAAAVTRDDPANPGTPLDVEVAGAPGVTGDAIALSVVEPLLTIDKSAAVTRADAGDVVTYTLTVSHTAQSTGSAFDLVITDDLLGVVLPAVPPDKLDLVADPAVSTSAGTVVIGGGAPGDQQVRVEIDRFDRDDAPIVITYSALLNGNVNAVGDAVTNTASLTWDSHGASPGEQRSAAPVTDNDTIDVPFTTPELTKRVVGSSLAHTGTARLDPALTDLVVGEVVSYRLVVTFNEGAYAPALDATVSDQLPAWLALVGAPRIVTGGTSGVGMNVNLDAGTITVLDNEGADGENDFFSIDLDLASVDVDLANPALVHDQIWIEYDARVLDVDDGVNNLNGNVLSNDATLLFDPAGLAVTKTADVDVEIVEPELVIGKSVSSATAGLGDTVTYTVIISHAPGSALPGGSGMAAYDVVLEDLLSSALTLVPGSVVVTEAPAGFATTGLVIASGNGAGDTSVRITAESLTLFTAPEGSLSITYDAVIGTDTAIYGGVVSNTATVAWDGIPGDDPNERREQALDGAMVRVIGPDLEVTKSDGLTVVTPGGALTYTIVVGNKAAPLGDAGNAEAATNVRVVDTLAAGLAFVASPDASFTGFDAATRELSWLIPLLNPGDSATLNVDVIAESPAPAGVETLVNTVSVSSDAFDPTPDDNIATDSTNLEASPDLAIAKTDGVSVAAPGEMLDYVLVVSNNGNQSTSGVVVTDSFVPGLYTDIFAARPDGVAEVTVDAVAGTITWRIPLLAAGDSITLDVRARVADPIAAGIERLDNTARVSDDGRSGADSNPGNETATDSNHLRNAAPDYVIAKGNARDTLRAGETTTWSITVSNVGNQDGSGVRVIDRFDPALVDAIRASDGGVVDGRAGTITWDLGALGGGASRVLTVTATLVQVPPPGTQEHVNLVTVRDDGRNGADPHPGNNTASDVDALQVFVFDTLRDEAHGPRSSFDDFFGRDVDSQRWLEPLPIDALFTGHAEPNTVLVVTLIDARGEALAQQVVLTDTGGNWVANFAGSVLTSQPHAISIGQQTSTINESSTGGFNLRTYFSPALQGQLFFVWQPTVETVFARVAGNGLEALAAANRDPLGLDWHGTPSHEFISSSSTTTQTVN